MADLYDEVWKRLKNAAREYVADPSAFAAGADEIAAKIIDEMAPHTHSDARDFYVGEFHAIIEQYTRERAEPEAPGLGFAPQPDSA